jgi:hypothetical protein
MDIPSKVYVTCALAELNKVLGTLIAVSPNGYYELHVDFGTNTHSVLLPIEATSLLSAEPILRPSAGFEVER